MTCVPFVRPPSTPPRARSWLSSVSCLRHGRSPATAQATPDGPRRPAAARQHPARGQGDHYRPAAERPHLLHPQERAARNGACCSAWRSRRARCSKTMTSAAWRTCSSTWRSTAPRISSRASSCRTSNRGFALRPARQRVHELRRDRLHAPGADRQAGAGGQGLDALADFAGAMTLDPKEIDKERGVVIEEWRLPAGRRLAHPREAGAGAYFKSRYAQRIPIGTPEILRTFRPAGCAISTTRGTGRSGWRSSPLATSIRRC